MKKLTYKHTLISCYICFIIQSIVNNFSPLLFVIFSDEMNVSVEQIAVLVSFNFMVQMVVDALGVRYADRIGYRRGMLIAHVTSFAGLVGLAVFTSVMPSFVGLIVATVFCALGSGFIEVLASPIVEALPLGDKSAAMSLLHSFYCWGHIAIVLLTTGFFVLFGTENWRYIALFWALFPLVNGILFSFVPLVPLSADGKKHGSFFKLFALREFPLFLILMICAGSMEQSVAQWVSYFAERGLNISKTVGDLLGGCSFALMMALARTFYGIFGERMNLKRTLSWCAVGILASVCLTVFSPIPVLSLVGCALTGLFVGIYWPGCLSVASARMPMGGTTMFAALALAGDVGCSLGPAVVGFVSGQLGGLKAGMLATIIFPLIAFTVLSVLIRREKREAK